VRWTRVGVSAVLLVWLGCGTSPTQPSSVPLNVDLTTALNRSIADEYRAETIYQGVIDDFGPLAPFVNVLTAEQRHSASIAQLFATRGQTPPAQSFTVATVPHFSSVAAACAAAAQAERDNVAMYDQLLLLTLPADVQRVFQNVRAASLLNHLPTFERCL
jgi:hypothetical protein